MFINYNSKYYSKNKISNVIYITIVDNNRWNYITIVFDLDQGYFYILSTNSTNSNYEMNIHPQQNSKNSVIRGIITDGNIRYNLDIIDHVPEIVIFARMNNEDFPEKYLESLISKAEIVTIIYNPNIINERYLYSHILKCGTSGKLK